LGRRSSHLCTPEGAMKATAPTICGTLMAT
jgi:hypothetical protein